MENNFKNGLEDPQGKLNGLGMKMLIVDLLLKDYKECPNVEFINDKLYCTTWYRHDDCVRVMKILYKITKDAKYSLPN